MFGIFEKCLTINTPYLSEESAKGLQNFKYVSKNDSYMFLHCINPLAELFITHTTWILSAVSVNTVHFYVLCNNNKNIDADDSLCNSFGV